MVREICRTAPGFKPIAEYQAVLQLQGDASSIRTDVFVDTSDYQKTTGDDDTFVLSKGHAAGALYVTLWSIGLITDDQLLEFHKDGTLLAGHPAAHWHERIAFATGSHLRTFHSLLIRIPITKTTNDPSMVAA